MCVGLLGDANLWLCVELLFEDESGFFGRGAAQLVFLIVGLVAGQRFLQHASGWRGPCVGHLVCFYVVNWVVLCALNLGRPTHKHL